MTSKGSFENPYEEYSSEIAINMLSGSEDGISEKFKSKLQNLITTKMTHLATNMERDIFYDNTVYTGSAGYTYHYLMNALSSKNEVYLDKLKIALSYLDLDNLKDRRISFLCGDAGPLAMGSVISYKLGTQRPKSLPNYKVLAERLMGLIKLMDNSPDELLYGKVGYLYALLFVNKYISNQDVIPSIHIEKVLSSIIKSGKQFSAHVKSESPLLWQWHDKIYFGAAHGISGILYMLLQARAYIATSDLLTLIKPTLDWLLKHQFPSGNFPSSLGSSTGDRLLQWCHGAPGFVPLCLLAAQVFEDEKYMKIAIQCGDVIWQRGLCVKGYSICHGVSGNAYAFIQLYQATKKPVHLYRACCFLEWCAVERAGTELHRPDRPASLFEGILGRLHLAEDIQHIEDSKFPAFTL